MSDFSLFLIIGIPVSLFLLYATKKRWVSWRGGKGIATLTAFHDFQPKDKQKAIEYVMEVQAGKNMEEQENGKNDDT